MVLDRAVTLLMVLSLTLHVMKDTLYKAVNLFTVTMATGQHLFHNVLRQHFHQHYQLFQLHVSKLFKLLTIMAFLYYL